MSDTSTLKICCLLSTLEMPNNNTIQYQMCIKNPDGFYDFFTKIVNNYKPLSNFVKKTFPAKQMFDQISYTPQSIVLSLDQEKIKIESSGKN